MHGRYGTSSSPSSSFSSLSAVNARLLVIDACSLGRCRPHEPWNVGFSRPASAALAVSTLLSEHLLSASRVHTFGVLLTISSFLLHPLPRGRLFVHTTCSVRGVQDVPPSADGVKVQRLLFLEILFFCNSLLKTLVNKTTVNVSVDVKQKQVGILPPGCKCFYMAKSRRHLLGHQDEFQATRPHSVSGVRTLIPSLVDLPRPPAPPVGPTLRGGGVGPKVTG